MIKIDKNSVAMPDSLKLPLPVHFQNGIVPRTSKTTHNRRLELITHGSYIDEKRYNERYKRPDIKKALKDLYKEKCAFCEQRVESRHVEHYRPKKTYYWLAFSWDNLLVACPTCNEFKGTHFAINGALANFANTHAAVQAIHCSSVGYDAAELPQMVNPEVTDPRGKISFSQDGRISSNDGCFAYTINTCKLDRPELNDERRALLDTFKKDIKAVLLENARQQDQAMGIRTIVNKFITDVTQFVISVTLHTLSGSLL
jgi:uncharacterized protein (TIGR02646 family)